MLNAGLEDCPRAAVSFISMRFGTVVNCMDGRVQNPVNAFLRARFGVDYVDTVTGAGPVRILSEAWGSEAAEIMIKNVQLSVDLHGSVGLAIVSHHDCAGNPIPKDEQLGQLKQAVRSLREQFNSLETIGLWVDESWQVHEVTSS